MVFIKNKLVATSYGSKKFNRRCPAWNPHLEGQDQHSLRSLSGLQSKHGGDSWLWACAHGKSVSEAVLKPVVRIFSSIRVFPRRTQNMKLLMCVHISSTLSPRLTLPFYLPSRNHKLYGSWRLTDQANQACCCGQCLLSCGLAHVWSIFKMWSIFLACLYAWG